MLSSPDELTATTWQHSLTPFFADRYRTILHQMQQAFCLVEVLFDEHYTPIDYRFLEINPAFVQQTGLPNPVGRTMRELAPEQEGYWFELLGQVVRTGQPRYVEERARHLGDRWYEVHALPTGPSGSHQVAILATDITERKAHERQQEYLLALSDALRSLAVADEIEATACHLLGNWLGAHRVYYVEIDEPAGTASVRKQYLRQGAASIAGEYAMAAYGWTAAAMRQNEVLVIDDVRQSALVPPPYLPAMEAVQQVAIVLVPLIKNGAWVGVLAVGDDAPREWQKEEVALAREVLERTWQAAQRARIEEALHALEKQRQLALEAAELGTWNWNLATDEVYWNERHYQQMGLPPAPGPLKPIDFFRFVHPQDQAEVERRLQAAVEHLQRFEAEFRVVTAQGEERWMSGHGQATERAPDGRARRMAGVMLDVTIRKVTEQELAETERLRLHLQQLTAVLDGQEEERRRIGESLHNGIGQVLFAAKLRLSQLTLQPQEPAWTAGMKLLTEAIRQTRAVSHELTPALLAEHGLPAALHEICQQLNSPGLHWHCYVDLADAPVLPVMLQQAVYRLVQGLAHNVAQHAQASEATIEVSALPNWLTLRVEDNGQGFDPATVIEGLGLKTLRNRIALLGGTVQVDSAPGQGTQIQARLPRS